jgi:hypothetical protein
MNLKDIHAFQFKRVNPFPGLAIDADTWRDAHNYSRDHQRLHNLIFHQVGIVEGLEVTENDPPDLSVNIHPGIAIDPEGNTIIVRNIYHYKIQNRDKETIYLIIQFREILEGPYQPPEGGQPTRIVDGYRIQERDNLPDEPHLELARIELDPAKGVIRNAENTQNPATNEINLNFRKEVRKISTQGTTQEIPGVPPGIISPKRKVLIGKVAVNGTDDTMHLHGLRNLVRDLEMHYNWEVELEENVTLDNSIGRFTLLYLVGGKGFKLNEDQHSAIEGFLKSNGVLFAEDCSEELVTENNTSKYGPVYDELIGKLKIRLKPVHKGDTLLSNINVFSEIPQGVKSDAFLMKANIIYSDNDYGCAWQGGYKNQPISRDTIRGAFEIGANVVDYAYQTKLSAKNKHSS